ncbi:zinc finger protein 862-like isoform X1 [Halichondria panicea]|uniref:zinc finger protein 862-like isoform X1 n=1 Tax=Halichondria panicea TaxID=6063 RepID=UPI00312B848C
MTQRNEFVNTIQSNLHFFSFLMDGTTDAGNVEDELIGIMGFCKNKAEVGSFVRFFSIQVPTKANADGLIVCVKQALEPFGIDSVLEKADVLASRPILIGSCTDGASVNIGQRNGMRGKMQRALPWIFWGWCYAHRLELACKDSFTSGLFQGISDMLLRLYYLYSKSPKKLRELAEVVSDLRGVFEFPKSGDTPIRSEGSRWISHKRQALQRIVDRYGAYMAHLESLAEDRSVSSSDRARLKGYLSKWQQGKILIGCSMYVDALKVPSMLSKVLQEEKLNIVSSLQNILKSKKSLQSLTDTDPLQWPTVKLICNRLTAGNEYQGATLKNYNQAMLTSCRDQALADVQRLDSSMRDVNLLRAILTFLDTQTWRAPVAEAEDKALTEVQNAVDVIATTFREPLEAVGVRILELQDEITEVLEYSRQYLSIETDGYKSVWYKLHVCPDAVRWENVILLCELCFSLLFSNGCIERMFSALKLVKTDRRTQLSHQMLTDILEI